ncbi:helicase [Berryella intestinalis]|uniref:Probable DNA 3'-5' helicase RecG n=1 Tax=Berryella intestinalis TaxID=1531429 RepID=A0A0A8B390_9ACTN|nr:helicase [Berryella intestinalis]
MEATMALDADASAVRLVSPARAAALRKLGVRTVRDLLEHFPRRYVDLSSVQAVAHAAIGENCTVNGRVHEVKLKRPRRNLSLVEISLVDDTGVLMVTAFRQPWLADQIKPGAAVAVAGKVEFNYGFKRMTNPFIEVLDDAGGQTGGLVVPIHPATEKLSTAWVRRLVRNALQHTAGMLDPLPLELRARRGLMSRGCAFNAIHFPRSMAEQASARRRLAYEEVLFLQLQLMRDESLNREGRVPVAHRVDGRRVTELSAALPFELSAEQRSAVGEILSVLAAPKPANHMLLGDVGTGKTVVAAHALAAVADTGTQAALMAPTEILARQHAATLGPLFDRVGVIWDVLTGSTPADERALLLERVEAGVVDVLIGTHALIEDAVRFKDLSLAVIDEQQRFGVDQRAKLVGKGSCPDALFLTATPIPRTLALALYGGMTLSYLRHRPAGAAPRATRVLTKDSRGIAYDAAKEALARGEQVYVVCPLVGASAAEGGKSADGGSQAESEYVYASISIESDDDLCEAELSSAEGEAAFLQTKVFTDHAVELVHGKMPARRKQEVMERFRSGQTQVLVATTVIEVGVDVAQATIMIIEDADRFGLAQLHQLRGRVGRAGLPAQVFLVSSSRSEQALARLAAMEGTDDGFELASFDLSLRREGDILGNRQHGASGLKLVNVVRDAALIEAAHEDARAIVEADPLLEGEDVRALAREARLSFSRSTEFQGG